MFIREDFIMRVTIKLSPGSMKSAVYLSGEKDTQDHRSPRQKIVNWLESSANRKKTNILKQWIEGEYCGRKAMEKSQDLEGH